MTSAIYYLPISTAALPHYIGSACIKPARYFSDKPGDIQNLSESHLLLTKQKGYKDTQCCLQLALTQEEEQRLIPIGGDWFLYDLFLPFSRVMKVLFSDGDKMRNTLANISLSTAFVPENMVALVDGFECGTEPKIPSQSFANTDISKSIGLYDRLMGAFTLMKTAYDNIYIPDSYFGLLGLLNKRVESEAKKALGNRYTEKYRMLLDRNERDKKIKLLSSNISDKTIADIAQQENQKVEYNPITRFIKLDSLDRFTYVLAVLNQYGVGQEARRKKIDELILSGFTSGIKPDKSEPVATYYGYNRGYSAFPKNYSSPDATTVKDTKFRFDRLLDYYTVESIYRYVVYNQVSDTFTMFESWWPKKYVLAGRNHILDYVIKQMPTRIRTAHELTSTPPLWLGDIATRCAKNFDPMKSSVYSVCLDVAVSVHKEMENRLAAVRQQPPQPQCVSAEDRQAFIGRCVELSDKSARELKSLAANKGISGWKNLKKADLIMAILMADDKN